MRWLPMAYVALALGCAPEAERAPGGAALSPCRIPAMGRPAECGIVEVPADRSKAAGPRLALHVVRLPATSAGAAAEPLFLLAGGPGQAASTAFAPLMPHLAALGRGRDLVLVDQRGSGQSAPFGCELPDDLAEQLRDDSFERLARRCARALSRDVGDYLTEDAADDLDAVRAALGYERVDLLGVSYGTRLALVYARRHPESARSLVLDGVAPPWMAIPSSFAADAARALDAHLARCAAGACGRAFGDVRAKLERVLASLEEEPRALTLPHPESGEPLSIELTRDGFALALRSLLYAPELVALLPYTVDRAEAGDFAPLVAQLALLLESAQQDMSMGLMLSVVCSEDLPRIEAAPEARGFVGDAAVRSFREACAVWPRAEVDPAFYRRDEIELPALLLSGELDPATPPRWAEDVLADLARGRHLVVPGMGHGVLVRSCVPKLVRLFLEAPEALASLDASCLADETPPFFVNASGPPP